MPVPRPRRRTRRVLVGSVPVGGGAPVAVQSMTNTRTADVEATAAQIRRLKEAGCDIVRVAVPDPDSARAIAELKRRVDIPIVADIHFDHRLALLALEAGCDSLRLNPGNLRDPAKVREVVAKAKTRHVPIRIGVNMGSVDRQRFGHDAAGLVASALRHIRILERHGFRDIKVSLKASDVPTTVQANRLMARLRPYPLHIGITEAGTEFSGAVRNAVGCGILLAEGLGDTLRVSLAADPVREVVAARLILRSLGLADGVEVIACPTCGRCGLDVERIARLVEERTAALRIPLRIAVMGCAVNGPGEASDADIGLAGAGPGKALLFRHGKPVATLPVDEAAQTLLDEISRLAPSTTPPPPAGPRLPTPLH